MMISGIHLSFEHLLLSLLVAVLAGCGSVSSNVYFPHDEVAERELTPRHDINGRHVKTDRRHYRGIPYHLPMAMMEVTVDISKSDAGAFEDLSMKVDAEYVPDEDALFYLNPSFNALFESDYNISINNGLLTSLDTEETGKADEFITSVVDTFVQFKKLGAVRAAAESGSTNPFLTANKVPTEAEIQHILGLLQTEQLSYQYSIESTPFKEYLPGSKDLMFITSNTQPAARAQTINRREVHYEPFDGVFTRTLQRATTSLNLYIDKDKLKNTRLASLREAIKSQDKAIATLKKTRDKNKAKVCEDDELEEAKAKKKNLGRQVDLVAAIRMQGGLSKEDISLYTEQIADLKSLKTDVQAEIDKCETNQSNFDTSETNLKNVNDLKKKYEGFVTKNGQSTILAEHFLVKQSTGVVLIPNRFQTVRVPVKRMIIGTSTNNLAFTDGILTGYDSTQPAAAVEFVKTIGTALQALVALPSELIQLKVDTAGEKQSALQAELDLVKKQRELDQENASTQLEITKIEQQLLLLAKQNEEAVARSDSAKEIADIDQRIALLAKRDELADQETEFADELNDIEDQLEILEQRALLATETAEPVTSELETLQTSQSIEEVEAAIAKLELAQQCTQEKIDNIGNAEFVVSAACAE